jgi:3-mercaptopyruvate sulfurtransferase SseA
MSWTKTGGAVPQSTVDRVAVLGERGVTRNLTVVLMGGQAVWFGWAVTFCLRLEGVWAAEEWG